MFQEAPQLKGLVSESGGLDPRVLNLENIRTCRQLRVLVVCLHT